MALISNNEYMFENTSGKPLPVKEYVDSVSRAVRNGRFARQLMTTI